MMRSPLASDAEVLVSTIPRCPMVIVVAACTAATIPIRKATAAARRMGMTIPPSKSGWSRSLEFRGGLESKKEAILAAGVRSGAGEAQIVHILRGQPHV